MSSPTHACPKFNDNNAAFSLSFTYGAEPRQAPSARGFTDHDNRGAPAACAGLRDPLGVELGDGVSDRLPHRRGEAARPRGNRLGVACVEPSLQEGGSGEGLGTVIEAVPELVEEVAELLKFCGQEAAAGREQRGDEAAGNLLGNVLAESTKRGEPRVVTQERENPATVALEDQKVTSHSDSNLVLLQEVDAQRGGEGDDGHHEERRRGLERTQTNFEGHAS
ncbi:hypothetical protein Emag_007649 [Eimeria magna]